MLGVIVGTLLKGGLDPGPGPGPEPGRNGNVAGDPRARRAAWMEAGEFTFRPIGGENVKAPREPGVMPASLGVVMVSGGWCVLRGAWWRSGTVGGASKLKMGAYRVELSFTSLSNLI